MKDAHQIDALLQEAVRSRQVAGVVAVAADETGPIYQGAAGVRSLADPSPMTRDTVFAIASMTKAVTGVAAMQMVEQGKLKLDQPAGEIIPQIGKVQVLEGFDPDGNPRLRAPKRPVTLRHLLTHTSGYSEDTFNAMMTRFAEKTGHPMPLGGKLAALNAPLIFDPGEDWAYGMSIDWAGQLVEAASGQRLDVYFRDNIFAPLGMTDTGYVPTDEQKTRAAGMHRRQPDGSLQFYVRPYPANREYWPGGGALYSTGGDYLTFLRMLLAGGSLNGARLLAPETVRLMAENHMGEVNVNPLAPARLDLSNNVEFFPGQPKKWGLTFLINTQDVPGRRRAGSLAWGGIANTYYWLDPRSRIAGVILTQILPFADPAVLKLLEDFETAIYADHGKS